MDKQHKRELKAIYLLLEHYKQKITEIPKTIDPAYECGGFEIIDSTDSLKKEFPASYTEQNKFYKIKANGVFVSDYGFLLSDLIARLERGKSDLYFLAQKEIDDNGKTTYKNRDKYIDLIMKYKRSEQCTASNPSF